MNAIRKEKLKDGVLASLKDAILGGELKPGDRIVEIKVASDMGVSQGTVREALKELEHFGLIENRSYKGTYVKRFTKKDVSDAYDARLILELFAVERAAETISPERLDFLHELMEKMNDAAKKGDVNSFVDYDVRFHEAIVSTCGNEMIVKLWHLANVSLWTLVATNLGKRSLKNLAARHTDIYSTLQSHDPLAVKEAMRIHLLELRDEMVEKAEEV